MSQSVDPLRRCSEENIAPSTGHECGTASWLACPCGDLTDLQTPPSIRSGDLSLDAPSVLILFDHDPRSAP